ncbi:hypothetical protein ACFL0X_00755 [Nanoarchaeota archaeon]
MKKLVVMAFLVLLLAGLASASTLVAGKIYNSDYSDTIEEAYVKVSCQHGEELNVLETISLWDGSYAVTFPERGEGACDGGENGNGDVVTVYAEKDGHSGQKTGVVNDNVFDESWDLAIVNVPLVPEFGFFIGALTLVSAIGVFFVIRRR